MFWFILLFTSHRLKADIIPIFLVDTFDETVGNACSIDRTTGLHFFSQLEELLGEAIDPVVLEGKSFSKKELEKLYSMDFKDDDFIFLFISSHGTRYATDKTSFPRIVFPDKENVSSFEIFENFKRCKHRSLLMVTDVCNNEISQIPDEDKDNLTSRRPFTPIRGSLSDDEITRKNASKLFSKSCFDLIINSSPANITSLITEHGSLFTTNFFFSMSTMLKSNTCSNIYDIIKNASRLTKVDTETYFKHRGDRKIINDTNCPYIPIDSLISNCNNDILTPYSKERFNLKVDIRKAAWIYRRHGNNYRLDIKTSCSSSIDCKVIESITYYLAESLHSQVVNRGNPSSVCIFNVRESTYITAIVTLTDGENVFLRSFVNVNGNK